MSQHVSADAGLLCDKAAVNGVMIKETLCITERFGSYSSVLFQKFIIFFTLLHI